MDEPIENSKNSEETTATEKDIAINYQTDRLIKKAKLSNSEVSQIEHKANPISLSANNDIKTVQTPQLAEITPPPPPPAIVEKSRIASNNSNPCSANDNISKNEEEPISSPARDNIIDYKDNFNPSSASSEDSTRYNITTSQTQQLAVIRTSPPPSAMSKPKQAKLRPPKKEDNPKVKKTTTKPETTRNKNDKKDDTTSKTRKITSMFLKTTKPTSEDKKTEGAQKPDLLKNQPKINCTESTKDFSNTFDQDTTTTNCSEQRKLSLPSKQLSGGYLGPDDNPD